MIKLEEILSSLPLEPSQRIADIGCGTGLLAIPLSRRLPGGKVYALDIAEEMLERLRQKADDGRITNIEMLKCGELDFPVPPKSVDGVLLAFVLHEQEDRVTFLERVVEMLKPRGWVAVVEWEKKMMEMGPPVAERIDENELGAMARGAGLDVLSKKGLGETHYLAVLQDLDTRSDQSSKLEAAS